ncbi:class I SAM-dependent methyltransferase [Natranaerofaba carboxydovora]|uniref:class I SAM-dependent methyltransferase n=1 Tax=Natranaerofaba carboxydovora TaxID=2742683 RepID=UPI001F1396A9|nr:class I SAM-dependent methyltransferase [Natranaerofaba carboxydovora]UMZ75013.1 dTDP-3-amino-3,4,6-trideoxy-alpha-D-glucopyranose [Natranaerofaba carboxydovora]
MEGENLWSDPHYLGYYLDMMKERYPENQTEREVNFIEKVIDLDRGASILDACCGCGRHAISLAKRGYDVIGVDLSKSLLEHAEATKNEKSMPGSVEFYEGDILNLDELGLEKKYQGVICMASLGYYMTDEDVKTSLQKIKETMTPGGWLLIDLINREKLIKTFRNKNWIKTETGYRCLRFTSFNLEMSRCENHKYVNDPDGNEKEFFQWLRTFTLREFLNILEEVGFNFQKVYGSYTREQYSVDSPRMIVICTNE